jgi:hypothetical protein
MGVSSDGHTVETEILDDGLTASDPAFALERLTFNRNGLSTLRLDRGVRDYLLDSLRSRRAR